MTELERNLLKPKSTSDQGKARQRKLKRESGSAKPAQTEAHASRRRSERRTSATSEPSNREQLVATRVRVPVVSLPALKEKITPKSVPASGKTSKDPSSRKTTRSSSEAASRSSRRKGEARRGDIPYEATSHAETQRIANADSGMLPRKSRRVYEARSESVPPVMVRGGMSGMAFGRKGSTRLHKQRSPRRRIDVPLNVTGAEVRLPSVPFLHLGWRAFSLLMVVMMSACLFLIWKAPVFQVTGVEAVGLQRLTVSDVSAVMGTFGKSVFTLNPGLLDETLHQAFPEFSKISVKINLPASVKVVVTERQPVISWVQDGVETWVDTDGVSFPPRGTPANTLVKVEGYGTPPSIAPTILPDEAQNTPTRMASEAAPIMPVLRLSPDLVSAILALSAKMPPDTVLVYDSVHGLGWNDPMGWEVYFGAEDEDMEMKLTVYQALVERLQSEGIQPALISVEYVHAPYYRMER